MYDNYGKESSDDDEVLGAGVCCRLPVKQNVPSSYASVLCRLADGHSVLVSKVLASVFRSESSWLLRMSPHPAIYEEDPASEGFPDPTNERQRPRYDK